MSHTHGPDQLGWSEDCLICYPEDARQVTAKAPLWHDEGDRLAIWGCLDPPDACMCKNCVLLDREGL